MSDEVRFETPPIQEVVLAILFEPMAAVSVLDLASFRLDLASNYPHAEELAPLPVWEGSTEFFISVLPGESKWPMPMCILANSARDIQVHVQNDRIGISWTKGLDTGRYPGFTDLYSRLVDAYDRFVSSIQNAGKPAPIARRVTIRYTNSLPSVPAEELSRGLLFGWEVSERPSGRGNWTTSLRMHSELPDSKDPLALMVMVDPAQTDDERPTADPEASVLRIGGDLDLEDDSDALSGLKSVHAVVLDKFLDFVSDDMIRAWGRSDQ